MTSRTLAFVASGIVYAAALAFVLVQPASAETADPGQRIVDVARQYLHQNEGQCFPWVRRVVAEATGNQMGYGYRDGYLDGGAIEVSLDEARVGDILQIADADNHGPGADYPGLHTSIVIEPESDGEFTVIDSNSQWDGVVRVRENYDPTDAAERYPNLSVRVYRFASMGPGGDASGETVQAASLTAGGTARVIGGGCTNLRPAPTTSGAPLTCVPDGSVVQVLAGTDAADGYQWRSVSWNGMTGWMADTFLQALSSTTPTPTNPTTPTSGTPGTSTGSLTGSLPTGGGPGLVMWGGGPVQNLVSTASTQGCSVLSVWTTVNGAFVGYTAGAPAFVNAQWSERYPGDVPATPLVLICGGAGTSTNNTPPPTAPSGGGNAPSAPDGNEPPGPAGNEA